MNEGSAVEELLCFEAKYSTAWLSITGTVPMTVQHFSNEIQIECDPNSIFDYVTNPNRWHEWYPSSQPSNKKYRASEVGQKFEIVTVQKPIKWLPITIKKTLNYTVSKSEYARTWKIAATSNLVDSITSYTLTPIGNGTLFRREFRYVTKSWLRVIEPMFLRKSIVTHARAGLDNLKARVELENA